MKFIPAKDPDTLPSDSRRVLVAAKRTNRVVTLVGCYYRKGELELHHEVDPFDGCYTPDQGGTWYAPEGWYSEMCDLCEMADTLEYNGSTVVGWSELPKFEEEDQ